jgi:hypothetical protein
MSVEAQTAPARYRWYHKLSAFAAIVVCLELGLFLVFFPWSKYWDDNFFSALSSSWELVWHNRYFRGAVSGLGVLDVYISFVEIFRLSRFWSTAGQ